MARMAIFNFLYTFILIFIAQAMPHSGNDRLTACLRIVKYKQEYYTKKPINEDRLFLTLQAICMASGIFIVNQDAQHAAQRLGRAPQQLVADSECAQVFLAHVQLAQAPDRN